MNLKDAMDNLIRNCEIYFEGYVISREKILRAYLKYFINNADKQKHNIGIVLHTGSIAFDVIAVTYAAISNLVLNTSSSRDVLEDLEVGDMVLYGDQKRSRYLFGGFIEHPVTHEECVLLTQEKYRTKEYVLEKRWRFIIPYFGEAKKQNGIGLKKRGSIREDFFVEVLGYETSDIPAMIDTATVIISSPERAERLVHGISYRFGEKEIRLLELVTAAYITENNIRHFSGNQAKIEPQLKFTNKVSVARKQILSKKGKRHVGLVATGEDVISRNGGELHDLMTRRTLRYAVASTTVDSENGQNLIMELEDASIFACTKEYLAQCDKTAKCNNVITQELMEKSNIILNRNLVKKDFDSILTWKDHIKFKRKIAILRKSGVESDEMKEFIIDACYMMNLLTTAVFTMNKMESYVLQNEYSGIVSPMGRVQQMKQHARTFSSYLRDTANEIIDTIDTLYKNLEFECPKQAYLMNCLIGARNRKIAVVVPKAYYASVILSELNERAVPVDNITITTANRFVNSKYYDEIIVVGNVFGSKFDATRCIASPLITSLLYTYERPIYRTRVNKIKRANRDINKRHYVRIHDVEEFVDEEPEDDESIYEINEVMNLDAQTDEYLNRMLDFSISKYIGYGSAASHATAITVAAAVFESGETAFFTKMYKAYVYNEDEKTTQEVEVSKLSAGDHIVFTQNNDEARDVVDSIVEALINNKVLPTFFEEAYSKSKQWKEALRSYKKRSGLSTTELTSLLKKHGLTVQPMTVRTWLYEECHTVGPKDKKTIRAIGRLVRDKDMEENYEAYFVACGVIRKLRMRILRLIGEAIIGRLNGKEPESNNAVAREIYNRLDSIALILQIERISSIQKEVPLNMTNRPLSIKE